MVINQNVENIHSNVHNVSNMPTENLEKGPKLSKWYFGGLASAGAAACTHPLDLLKVQMQTHKGKSISLFGLTRGIIKKEGILGLYTGISASLARQLSYSTARFGIYETAKHHIAPKDGSALPFHMSAFLAALGGMAGGLVGNPADLVNVRMQNDNKLPPKERRNYKNVFHGIYSVARKDGPLALWGGSTMNCTRAVFMTIGQLAFYDFVKDLLLHTSYFEDNIVTHVTSSLSAGAMAVTMTQPVDVLKTRVMNARKGEGAGITKVLLATAKEGPAAFFKGYLPAFARLAPQTILTFVFLEKLKENFGYTETQL